MKKILAALLGACLFSAPAMAQQTNAATTNGSVSVTTGNTYQTLLAAVVYPTVRRSLTIQNNNTTDNCLLIVGTNQVTSGTTTTSSNLTIAGNTLAASKASILLSPGQSYTRYFPYIPNDTIYATCATTGDSIYVDTQ